MKLLEPIKLLSGTHDHTARTGQGCFMNVISYLNGEPQITDNSPCVCFTIKRIAIWLNDYMRDGERGQLIPFIERAMGSRTDDRAEINRRLKLVVSFAEFCRDHARESANAAAYANANAYANAANAAADAAAANAAADAANANAATTAATAAANANAYANAANAAADAAADAAYANAATAAYANAYAYAKRRKTLIAAAIKLLDEVLPPAYEPAPIVLERAQRLVELQA